MTSTPPRALSIAGSDSGAGAGIQADLKTFAALGVYGTTVITAVTAQNTREVTRILELPPDVVVAQINAVVTDIGVDALKTGMLYNASIIEVVAECIRAYRLHKLVVDPVMVAKGGHPLLQEDAVQTLKSSLFPLALVITPNIPEAEKLTGLSIATPADVERAAEALHALGPQYVLIKGGHLASDPIDVLYDGHQFYRFPGKRIVTPNTHGTGCTFSAAITAHLARGEPITKAITLAKEYITSAIQHSLSIGSGHGPVNHFFRPPDDRH